MTSSATDPIWLFTAQTTSANGVAAVFSYPNKIACVTAFGTWDGATLKLQTLAPDNTTWVDVSNASGSAVTFTANAQTTLTSMIYSQQIRGVLSNAGDSTSLNLTLQAV